MQVASLWVGEAAQVVVVLACSMYFARRRSGPSFALLLGAVGGLIVSLVPVTLILSASSPQTTMSVMGSVQWITVGASLLFAVSLFLVLREAPAGPT
jgi:RsiW-degrading membrane proteinase PrsW (M82 family)